MQPSKTIPVSAELERLRALGVVPVVELPEVDCAAPMLEALMAAGLPIVEVTLRTPAGLPAIAALVAAYPEALIGAGTVRTVEEVERAADAGARFIVSPTTNQGVVRRTAQLGLTPIPGACTPTEVDTALSAGAAAVKLFPAEAIGGIAYLKALLGPFRECAFVPTGGIKPDNLASYLEISQVIACGGTWLAPPSLLLEGAYAQIRTNAAEARAIVANVRERSRG